MTDPRTPTSDSVAEPQTEAGRALLEREAYNSRSFAIVTVDAILAIEAEARQQDRAAFAAQVAGLVRAAMNELGVPGPGYPAPVANAVGYLEQIAALLAASPEPASPEAPGSGLREALLRIYDLSMADGISARLDIREVAGAALAARPDGAAHRMGPPRWEPGNAQDEWTNRCLACGERWPCAAARPDGAEADAS